MDLIDKEDPRNEFGDSLVNIAVNDFVDLCSKFLGDFGFLGLHDLPHQTHEIVASLRFSVSHIQIMQSDILDDLFLLVDVSFRKRNVLLSLEVKLTGVGIATSNSLYVAC